MTPAELLAQATRHLQEALTALTAARALLNSPTRHLTEGTVLTDDHLDELARLASASDRGYDDLRRALH